jgi:hypothetical protein
MLGEAGLLRIIRLMEDAHAPTLIDTLLVEIAGRHALRRLPLLYSGQSL